MGSRQKLASLRVNNPAKVKKVILIDTAADGFRLRRGCRHGSIVFVSLFMFLLRNCVSRRQSHNNLRGHHHR